MADQSPDAPRRSGRSKKDRKASKQSVDDDGMLSDEPLGAVEFPEDQDYQDGSSGPPVVVEGVDIDQPEHQNSMRKYVVALRTRNHLNLSGTKVP
jgi:hypothetical protein